MAKEQTFFSPGRVNLIGDHTDYNGGLVFPAALTMGTYLTIKPSDDDESCGFYSENKTETYRLLQGRPISAQHSWVDYPLGVVKEFVDRGIDIRGYDFHFRGDLPIGAALSSSASIEMATAFALNSLSGNPFSLLEIVQMAQHAENDFVGMNCGIMDQFASGFGKKNHAIALDCNTLQYEWVPLEMQHLKLVITNTNKKRELVDSAYNQRRTECEQALRLIQREIPVATLCELTMEQFQQVQHLLEGNVLCRARHAVSENTRVKEALKALKIKDMERFGKLMNDSHRSLRDDYAVTCPELDFLAEIAQQFDGVLGSRMTGAGFGGCTITLLHESVVSAFIRTVGSQYERQCHLKADFYVADIGDGSTLLEN